MDFYALAAECAPRVASNTLAAIVRTESGFEPLAIGINGGAKLERQPVAKEEAIVTAKWLVANGYNIDLGLGQINSSNLVKMGLSIDDVFDPCKNLAASASILQGNYRSGSRQTSSEQAALHAALSAYNTGSITKGFANGYVQKVISNSANASVKPVPVPVSRDARTTGKKQVVAKGQRGNSTEGNSRAVTPLVNALGASSQDIMVYH